MSATPLHPSGKQVRFVALVSFLNSVFGLARPAIVVALQSLLRHSMNRMTAFSRCSAVSPLWRHGRRGTPLPRRQRLNSRNSKSVCFGYSDGRPLAALCQVPAACIAAASPGMVCMPHSCRWSNRTHSQHRQFRQRET